MPQPRTASTGLVVMAVCALGCPSGAQAPAAREVFAATIRPLVERYCLSCHSSEKQKGDVDLEQFATFEAVLRQPDVWQMVADQLRDHEMPPKEKPQPEPELREQVLQWVQVMLDDVGRARDGDPGPVVLRRLSNAEYTYTLRDITGLGSLDPAREFPVDGAAGEGFQNVGNALVMSPALLTKYLDAGKQVAQHLVLLPDGIRFAPGVTRRDWTDDLIARIRAFYARFSETGSGDVVNLQGILVKTNEGGQLPLARYLAATVRLRDGAGSPDAVAAVAAAEGLNARYLGILFDALRSPAPSLLLDPIRARWRRCAPGDLGAVHDEIVAWQHVLWRFHTIGHIGKVGGPKSWMEQVSPVATSQAMRIPMTRGEDADIVLRMQASACGDAGDVAVLWRKPRFVGAGRPDLMLRDLRQAVRAAHAWREQRVATAVEGLAAADEVDRSRGLIPLAEVAGHHAIDVDTVSAWLACLGIVVDDRPGEATRFTAVLERPSAYDFIHGWGSAATPLVLANASGELVRVPGTMKPHSVAVHPSPTQRAVVEWCSPVAARVRVVSAVQHVHLACGNGVAWAVEVQRGPLRQRLAHGVAARDDVQRREIDGVEVQPGDRVRVLVGARNGDHTCDLTAVDLEITSGAAGGREWSLAADCSADVLAANPHPDRYGNAAVWQFSSEPDQGDPTAVFLPSADSLLARWRSASTAEERRQFAIAIHELLGDARGAVVAPDDVLRRGLLALDGPLSLRAGVVVPAPVAAGPQATDEVWGIAPERFGGDAAAGAVDCDDLRVAADAVVEFRVPADLVSGMEFVVDGEVLGGDGAVQLHVATAERASEASALVASAPIVVSADGVARQRVEAACDEFRSLFPAALCYTKIVPVDEVVTLTQFYREDEPLRRLMLDDAQTREIDALWDELHFVAQDALTQVDAFEQLYQFATQDADPSAFAPMREPIAQAAAAFRQRLVASEPRHLEAVLEFAALAYRRPLREPERDALRGLYRELRGKEMGHDEAIRLLVARILLAPAFLYHEERPGPGSADAPVSDWELASRLSYFLWSSAPDAELRAAAARGDLHDDHELAAQTRRLLRDPRVRRLGTEFGCAWLHVYAFDELLEKSERHFPTFDGLRGAMYEESIRFLTSLFQENAPELDLLDADYTFLAEPLAAHYGIPGVTGEQWRRVDGVRRYGRGGILGLATTLAKQSGASRTSPILRGNWVCEALLGDKLPRPPKDVPKLPEDEATEQLTVRQLVERHSSDPRCARCHERMDAFGFALEEFDAIGGRRERDLGGRPIDARAKTRDGAEFAGIDGLRQYLLTTRREAFLAQFHRKLLGYALGRAVQISDRPLLAAMMARAGEQRMDDLVVSIVLSRQFRQIRGRDRQGED